MRVFAVQIDDDLFDAITERVKELGTTKRGYIRILDLKRTAGITGGKTNSTVGIRSRE